MICIGTSQKIQEQNKKNRKDRQRDSLTERQKDRTDRQDRQTRKNRQTRPDQSRPDQTKPEQNRPDQTRHTERTDRPDTAQQKYIYTGTENQNPVPLGGTPPPLPPKHSARAERKEWWKGWLLQAVPSPSGVLWVEVGSVHVIKAREDKTKHDEKRQDKTRQEKIRT